MSKKWMFLALPAVVVFIAIGGEVVEQLWNALVPAIFGWRQIGFWQAVGLLALCRILFGRIGGRGFHRHGVRRRLNERWERMTPEEREKFRQGLRSRCGGFGSPGGATETTGTSAPA
jgi:hypothetical protein